MQSCTKCPAGYKCPDSSADDGGATPCSSGTYSSGGQDSCTECPAGFKCPMPFAAYVVPCVPGTYSEANAPVINVCGFWTNCVASFSANIHPLFRNRCVQIVLLGRNARKTTPQAPPALLAGSAQAGKRAAHSALLDPYAPTLPSLLLFARMVCAFVAIAALCKAYSVMQNIQCDAKHTV